MHFVDGMGLGFKGRGDRKKIALDSFFHLPLIVIVIVTVVVIVIVILFFSTSLSSQVVYVMPSTSGRTQTYPRASDKLPFFLELKSLRDELKANSVHHSSPEEEVKSSINET